ncbi:MAG TPA: tetratricopeptide repeat protein [Candidatus Eisenbacteria bacterium]
MTRKREKRGAKGERRPVKREGSDAARARLSWLLWLAGIVAATFLVYLPCLDNKFTDWDDNFYVTENALVAHPSLHGILTTPVAGNYHPLTMASLALNYRLSGLDPASYHWLNLLLHLANTALVFFFVRRLTKGRFWTTVATAAFFGIHPMHVESVAWIAERKDVLYAFFYLAGLIAYLRYVDGRKLAWLGGALAAFALSAAAKPAAVVFPITLLAIDYFRRRPFSPAIIWEKAPFFLVALLDGILTLSAQRAGGAISDQWSLLQRIFFASYGVVMYVVKLVLPFRLSAIYPYPHVGGVPIDPKYAVSFVALIVLVPLLWFVFRRVRVVIFGLAFYLINVALVLQLSTVGGAVMAERYTYVPYIGLLLALAWWLDEPMEKMRFGAVVRPALAVLLLALAPVSLLQTWKRCDVWQNAETLWDDTIRKYPGQIADAYINRGFYYYHDAKRYEAAVADFDQALALNPNVAKAWLNKGNALAALERNDSSRVCFDRAIALQPNLADAWNNRGGIKLRANDLAGADSDFTRAIELDPNHRDAHANRGLVEIMTRRYEPAIADCRRAVELDPANPANYLQVGSIGFALQQLKRHQEAIGEYDEAIRTCPPGEPRLSAYYLYRSFSRAALGDSAAALRDARDAQRLGATVTPAYLKKLGGAP